MSKRKAPDKDEEDDEDDPNEDEEEKRRREDREDDEMQERLTKRSSKDRMGCAPIAAPALCCPQDIALRVHPPCRAVSCMSNLSRWLPRSSSLALSSSSGPSSLALR